MSTTMSGPCSLWVADDYKVTRVLKHIRGEKSSEWDKLEVHGFITMSIDTKGPTGWTKVGTAEIQVTLLSEAEIQGETVAMLKEQIKSVQAAAQNEITRLTQKLNEVLAITMDTAETLNDN